MANERSITAEEADWRRARWDASSRCRPDHGEGRVDELVSAEEAGQVRSCKRSRRAGPEAATPSPPPSPATVSASWLQWPTIQWGGLERVAGESFRQHELQKGPRSGRESGRAYTSRTAQLLLEPANQHDANAVMVLIGGEHVGHLPRENARSAHGLIGSLNQRRRSAVRPDGDLQGAQGPPRCGDAKGDARRGVERVPLPALSRRITARAMQRDLSGQAIGPLTFSLSPAPAAPGCRPRSARRTARRRRP